MLQRPTFADMDREREVVLEEIAMYEDEPQDIVHDMALAAVFPDHPLGRPVLGRREVVAAIPESGMRAYHRNHYRAGNIVLAGAGGMEEDDLLALGDRLFTDLDNGEVAGDLEARLTERADAALSREGDRAIPPLCDRARYLAR